MAEIVRLEIGNPVQWLGLDNRSGFNADNIARPIKCDIFHYRGGDIAAFSAAAFDIQTYRNAGARLDRSIHIRCLDIIGDALP